MPKAKSKSTAATLAPDPQLTALKSRVTSLLKAVAKLSEVTDTPSFEAASTVLTAAVVVRKDLKALPVYVELARQKADIKAKEKLLKDVEKTIIEAEVQVRVMLELYAEAQRAAKQRQIDSAMSKGKDEKAAAIAATPFVPPVAGLSFTEHWHAEITDLKALIEAVASEKVSPEAIMPNLVWLNSQARVDKEAMSIPGVKAVKETSSAVRT
jgi:hypothetical protein